MDRSALDWFFSTAPQALAALVGLIFAGMSFINGTIEKEIAQDETRKEICEAMKKEIHTLMKYMFWFAGVSIVMDLSLLMANPIKKDTLFSFSGQFDLYYLIIGVAFLLNVFTLWFSLWFIVRVASPNFFKKTVEKLSKTLMGGDVAAKDYLMEYIKLEKALRELPLNIVKERGQPTISEILRELGFREILKNKDVKRLFELNRLRNLIVHGSGIGQVSNDVYCDLKKYIQVISNLKNQI